MSDEVNGDLDLLLAHEAWVRRLARRLARSADEADDLAQETWLAALRGRWTGSGAPRAFLAGILRKRALQGQRAEIRRGDREAQASSSAAEPSVVEALERAELGRELSRLVVELEEPLRSAVLLRHVSGLSVRAVAERLALPVKTVEARLARGRARLRERWTQRHGSQARGWLALLAGLPAPVSRPPPIPFQGAPAPAFGALLVNTKLALSVLVLLGGGGLVWLAVGLAPASPERALPALAGKQQAKVGAPTLDAHPRAPAAAHPDGRAAVNAGAQAPPVEQSAPAAGAELQALAGRVLDPQARPLSGVPVVFSAQVNERARSLSDAGGRFQLLARAESGRVASRSQELEDLYSLSARPGSRAELLLVSAPHRPLAGVVRDEHGLPVPEAEVQLELPAGFSSRFDAVLDANDQRAWRTRTDELGRFALERVPVVGDALLTARLNGYEPAVCEPPQEPAHDLELILERPVPNGADLAGRVSNAAGVPVQGALVSLGERAATTAVDGTFQLERGESEALELVAVLPGHLPGRLWALPDPLTGGPQWPPWVELRLGASSLELGGQVLDAAGQPRAGLKLWLDDPTEFGLLGDDLWVQLESLAAPVDSTFDDSSDGYFPWTTTDAQGRFLIQGLLERDYTLGLLDPLTLETTRAGPCAAGRLDLRLEFPRTETRRIRGRVLSPRGTALEGLTVALHGAMFGGVHHRHSEQLSAADGRFAFEGIAGTDLTLWIRGEQVVPIVWGVDEPLDQETEIVVEVLCHLKVDLSDQPALADRFHVVDAAGAALPLREIGANGVLTRDAWELIAGRSITLGVPETAAELVLEKHGLAVRRMPLRLEPGRLEVVRP